MTRRISEQVPEIKQTSFVRISMDPLYDKLLKKPFPDSVSAIEFCRSVCAEFGFTVKQEASANRNIYVYCSREGLPDSQRNPKPSPQRKRPSKRCDCRWRVVLSENEHEEWEFRKSMNPNASEHNHEMMSPDEMVKAWPSEVNEMIIQLARQRLQTHEIREAVKQHFPDITWNERRFYNRLTEERKRIRQRGVIERAQRLLLISARLCSVIANHEDWTVSVESDLKRMFENFCQMARLTPEAINTLVDLQPEKIQLETDRLISHTNGLSIASDADEEELTGSPTKKRKATAVKSDNSSVSTNKSDSSNSSTKTASSPEPQKGIQMVHVPSYTIGVRSFSHRGNNSRYVYPESPYLEQQAMLQHQQPSFNPNTTFFPLASPTSSASSSSSVPFVQRMTSSQMHSMTSPSHPLHSGTSPSDFMVSSYQTAAQAHGLMPHTTTAPSDNHDYHHHINNIMNLSNMASGSTATTNTTNATTHTTGAVTYSMPNSFPNYTMPTSTTFANTTAATDVPFTFEPMIRTASSNDRPSLAPHSEHEAFYNPSAAAAVAVKEVDYGLSSSRSFHSQTQQSYSLPMIRANEETSAQWS